MSLDSELLSQGFWQQGLQGTASIPTATRYGLYPQPPRLSVSADGSVQSQPEKVGRLRQGGYAKCGTLKGLCGPVDPTSGNQLPFERCVPPHKVFNCYYDGNPTPQRATLMATLSSEPFRDVMKTVYSQPSYGDAVQTFFAGNV